MVRKYDFSGWATRNNLKCSDGRTILKDAFKDDDGQKVPLVWNHQHNDPLNVLGHALLENRDEGVYAYCTFNNTESGQSAKTLVEHGDVSALSIYANKLRQQGGNVLHGAIREVSLVLAGANPGAFIDSVVQHDDGYDESAVIYTGENITMYHSEKPEEVVEHAEKEKEGDNMPQENNDSGKTIGDVLDSMTEEQRTVLYAIVGNILEENEMKQSDFEEDDEFMKHNVFDQDEMVEENVLSHDAMTTIINDGKRYGSLKESFLAHAGDYGIDDIEWLFPDAKNLNNPPEWIKRDTGWVARVMNGVHHTPFSRIKSMFADLTEEEARAKGYLKGNLKMEQVFGMLKRETTPTTIYKKQKLDRDDVIDITDFDVVAWLKGEMRVMLDEEIARAILVGDGRPVSSNDKINELNIRPIWKDEDLFVINQTVSVTSNDSDDSKAKKFIRAAVKSRKNYKGSGNPVLYTTEDVLTDCLLIEDTTGRIIYESVEKLKAALRVSDIVTVPIMENLTRTGSQSETRTLLGIIVNLSDYNVGADKGGAINMFDDFDIDYNQQKYLIETRCSGALTKPYSAIVLEQVTA